VGYILAIGGYFTLFQNMETTNKKREVIKPIKSKQRVALEF